MLEIDLSGVLRSELAPGEYAGVIVEAKQETSKKSGNPMLTLAVRVDDGQLVWIRYPLVQQALWKLARDFTRIGLRKEGETTLRFDPEQLVGLAVYVKLESRLDKDGNERLEPEIMGLVESDY